MDGHELKPNQRQTKTVSVSTPLYPGQMLSVTMIVKFTTGNCLLSLLLNYNLKNNKDILFYKLTNIKWHHLAEVV